MKRKFLTAASCLLLVSVMLPEGLPAADQGGKQQEDLTRVRRKVEALRAWQLTEELDLDEKTAARLFPAMREMDQERAAIEARNRELVQEMLRLSRDDRPDRGRIDAILDELMANRQETARIEERHLRRVRGILPPEKTATYILFQVRFQKEIRERAVRALQERRGSGDVRERGGPGAASRQGPERGGSAEGGSDAEGGGGSGQGGDGQGGGSGMGR